MKRTGQRAAAEAGRRRRLLAGPLLALALAVFMTCTARHDARAAEPAPDCLRSFGPACLIRMAATDLEDASRTISRPYALRLAGLWAIERRDWPLIVRMLGDDGLPARTRFRIGRLLTFEPGPVPAPVAQAVADVEATLAPAIPVGPRWFPEDLSRRLVVVQLLAAAGQTEKARALIAPVRAELDRRGAGAPPMPPYPCFGHNPWRVNEAFFGTASLSLSGRRDATAASQLAVALAALGDIDNARRYLRSDRGSITCALHLSQLVRALPGTGWIGRLEPLPEWRQMPVSQAALAAIRIGRLVADGRREEAQRQLRQALERFADQPPLTVASLLIEAERLDEGALLGAWAARNPESDMPAPLIGALARGMIRKNDRAGMAWLTPVALRQFRNETVQRFDRFRLAGPLAAMLAAQGRLRAAEEIALRATGDRLSAEQKLAIGFAVLRRDGVRNGTESGLGDDAMRLLREAEAELAERSARSARSDYLAALHFASIAAILATRPQPAYRAKARAFLEAVAARRPYERLRRRKQMHDWLARLGIRRFPIDPPAETKKD